MSASFAPSTPPALLVVCLCAAWCGTCTAYRTVFDDTAAAHPQARFLWVDIEDEADALEAGDEAIPDIENFPTLMLLRDGQPVFHGTVLPHAPVLQRLLQQAAALPALGDPAVQALGRAVAALAAR